MTESDQALELTRTDSTLGARMWLYSLATAYYTDNIVWRKQAVDGFLIAWDNADLTIMGTQVLTLLLHQSLPKNPNMLPVQL